MDGSGEDITTTAEASLRARLARLRDGLADGLVEREVPARLALLAVLAGEHLLLVGPPGTAKSALARRLCSVLRGATYFERLLTRFSVPEELFGPLSIKALERDEYLRLTESYLPSATVAFLDEIFKANSAILNSLLTLLNEREFDNGPRRVRTPLACVVAASNELPAGDELGALYDRFLLRYRVAPVSDDGFDALLGLADGRPGASDPDLALAPEELARLRIGAASAALGPHARALLKSLRTFLAGRGVYVSDRRWRKIAGLLRTAAHTDARAEVSLLDAWLLEHCTWERPEQQAVVREWLDQHAAEMLDAEPARLAAVLEAHEQAVTEYRAMRTQREDDQRRALFVGDDGVEPVTLPTRRTRRATKEGELLYYAPAGAKPPPGVAARHDYTIRELFDCFFPSDLRGLEAHVSAFENEAWDSVSREPLMEPARFAPAYIGSMIAQVNDLARDVARELAHVEATLRSVSESAATLWLPAGQFTSLRDALGGALGALSSLVPRLDRAREGYAALPRNPAL